jgi:geranylgeranyl diphosphate synthase type I
MTDILNILMADMLPLVEREMKDVLSDRYSRTPARFYQMMHYHMGWLDETLVAVVGNGGKRIRPILSLLCAAASGDGAWKPALPAAAAVELLHNFTLIHDDIQDKSPTRRGRPSVWKLWGIPQAINVGDAMFALAHDALYGLHDRTVPPGTIVRAARRFDDTCLALTIGQHRDMNFETQMDVSVSEYVDMIEGKTAALLALCGELGSMIGGANEKTVSHYATFAMNLGLAFQVKDDILGIWGDEDEIGKSAATDIMTRKKTLPVLFGLERSGDLRALYKSKASDERFVAQAVDLLDEVGALEFAQARAADYSQKALEHLSRAEPQGPAADGLQELVSLLLSRKH